MSLMRYYYIVILLLLCFAYAFYFGHNKEEKTFGLPICQKNVFQSVDSYSSSDDHSSRYPSVYSKLFLGCKLKKPEAEDKEALDLFYRTGTGHFLSIAGLHLGAIALIVYLIFNSLFYLWSWKRKRTYMPFFRVSLIASVVTIFVYVLLIGFELPRSRALIMISLSALSMVFVVLRNRFVVLALAACVFLLITPEAVYSYSFYYSFMCVLGILMSPSKKSINICIVIFVFILPLNLHSSGTLDISSIISNFVAIPLFVFLYFPLQLILFGLLMVGNKGVLLLMDRMTAVLLKLLYLLDAVGSHIRINILPINTVEAVMLYFILFMTVLVVFYRKTLNRRRVVLIYLSFSVLTFFSGIYFYLNYFSTTDSITVFGIEKPRRYNGSGDLILVRLGEFNVLVDTGYGDYSVKKALKDIRRLKISKIDYLILSHSDIDHTGGLGYVLNSSGLNVKKVLVSPCMYLHKEKLQFKGRVYEVCDNSEIILDEKRKISFVHPACSDRKRCSNDSAVVSIIDVNAYKVILSADTPIKKLKKIPELSNGHDFSKTLFQFPHHCSAKEAPDTLFYSKPLLGFCTRSPDLLKSGVNPADYAFPVFMTGRCGTINIELQGKEIKISSQRCRKVYNFT